jgi:hypothetical protein
MISDPALRARHFAATDHYGPDLDIVKTSPYLLDYLRGSGREISLYRCRGSWANRRANMYKYYRVYGWDAFNEEVPAMGLWSYSIDWGSYHNPWTSGAENYNLVYRHPTRNELVHSRLYETFREGIDDYRYLHKLREVAQTRDPEGQAYAEALIQSAIADITSNVEDTSRCETWRIQIAEEILTSATPACGDILHRYPVGDLNEDCRVNLADFSKFLEHWMACTHSLCD